MLKEGMILGERYEIISKIGTGGMADVYKARDHKLNRLVAVKVLKAEFQGDKSFVAKFRKEAQAAAGLAHPNIVNVYDVGEDEDLKFIVMELVEGITLKDYITRKGKLSVKEATSIAIQVSLGLEAAHNNNIVHRDVKPQNIIISTDGKVKLSDFGIARAVTSNTITSNVMVSVHYSSPEQVRGGYSDKKSDIYSLGITMYEMVTGRVPFDGDTSVAIAIKHLQEEMVPPSTYTNNLPYSLEQIIMKCTQKSVDRRYNNLSEVIEDLKRSLVDPQGNFVALPSLSDHAQTVRMSQAQMNVIKGEPQQQNPYSYQQQEPKREEPKEYFDEDLDDEYDDYDDDGISSKLEKAMTIGGFVIGAIIICILVYFIGTAAGIFKVDSKKENQQQTEQQDNREDDGDTVEVPDLRGMTVEQAEEAVKDLGIALTKAAEMPSSDYARGQIMDQNITPGDKIEKNGTVEYTLSVGSSELTVPNVVGQPQAEAEEQLRAMGLEVEIQQNTSTDIDMGNVISVSPDVGSAVNQGDTVTLTISLGVSDEEVTVPSVIGYDEESAKSILSEKGLNVTVETGSSINVAEGEIYDQSIGEGTVVNSGASITIYVNNPYADDSDSEDGDSSDSDSDDSNSYDGDSSDSDSDTSNDYSSDGSSMGDENSDSSSTDNENGDDTSTDGSTDGSSDNTDDGDGTNDYDTDGDGSSDSQNQDSITGDESNAGAEGDASVLDPSEEDDSSDVSYSGSWTCTSPLGQPSNYEGGPVMMVLDQNGNQTTIIDGETISFPYSLNIAGADGVSSGTVIMYEMVNGDYVERASYPVTFSQS